MYVAANVKNCDTFKSLKMIYFIRHSFFNIIYTNTGGQISLTLSARVLPLYVRISHL